MIQSNFNRRGVVWCVAELQVACDFRDTLAEIRTKWRIERRPFCVSEAVTRQSPFVHSSIPEKEGLRLYSTRGVCLWLRAAVYTCGRFSRLWEKLAETCEHFLHCNSKEYSCINALPRSAFAIPKSLLYFKCRMPFFLSCYLDLSRNKLPPQIGSGGSVYFNKYGPPGNEYIRKTLIYMDPHWYSWTYWKKQRWTPCTEFMKRTVMCKDARDYESISCWVWTFLNLLLTSLRGQRPLHQNKYTTVDLPELIYWYWHAGQWQESFHSKEFGSLWTFLNILLSSTPVCREPFTAANLSDELWTSLNPFINTSTHKQLNTDYKCHNEHLVLIAKHNKLIRNTPVYLHTLKTKSYWK